MPDFSIEDSLANPTDISNVNWTSASSVFTWAKSESLRLLVAPDFLARKDQSLRDAAANPITFSASLQHAFQLGGSSPEVNFKPGAKAVLIANASAGSDLFGDDPFHLGARVPANTAYTGLALTGSLGPGVSGSSGDLTFGVDRDAAITFEYLKAFAAESIQPTLGEATKAAISGFVIPATVADLRLLGENDICCVSGQGSLRISCGANVEVPVNPLASLRLPLSFGTVSVQDGAMAGLSAAFTLRGSWRIRVENTADGSIRLSYLKEAGTQIEIDMSASAGVRVSAGGTDLLAKLIGGIARDSFSPAMLDGLTADEKEIFTSAVKDGVDHSLRASLEGALSNDEDHQACFQYEIRPDLLDASSTDALSRALRGDLTLLTTLEQNARPDGSIAPGVRLLNSAFAAARTRGASLKVNLLGIVNLLSVSKLIQKCEILYEPSSGEVTIRETAGSEKIGAIADPAKRQDALRQALYYSVLATTTYVAGKAAVIPALTCDAAHFTSTQNATKETIAEYANWLVALGLITPEQRAEIGGRFAGGGKAACVVRAPFGDAACQALFFDPAGKLRERDEYCEIGRESLKALIDPSGGDIARARHALLDDAATWSRALAIGPGPELRTLIPLPSADPKFEIVLSDIIGDLAQIVWWAETMQKAGTALSEMRAFLAGRDGANPAGDADFIRHRDNLQKLMVDMAAKSGLRFTDPWGIVSLCRAAGCRGASGKITANGISIEKSQTAAATPA